MAGIIKRGNVWWACWSAGGKQVRKTTGVHVKPVRGVDPRGVTARQLEQLARATAEGMEAVAGGGRTLEQAMAALRAVAGMSGVGGGRREITLAEWAEQWLETQASKRSLGLKRTAITRFLRILGPKWGEAGLSVVTPAAVQDFITGALDEVGASTVDRDLAEISAMFNRAVDEGLIPRNPARSARIPAWALAEDVQQRRPFTSAEVRLMVTTFPGEWPDMVRACLLLGGQRLGDVACLRWEQFDLARGVVRLRTQKTRLGMTKPLIAPLRELVERRKAEPWAGLTEYIFPLSQAKYGSAGGASSKLSLEFRGLLEGAGILDPKEKRPEGRDYARRRRVAEVSFHSLRATAVTALTALGYERAMVEYIVGHSPKTTEEKHYLRLGCETEGAALAKMFGSLVEGGRESD